MRPSSIPQASRPLLARQQELVDQIVTRTYVGRPEIGLQTGREGRDPLMIVADHLVTALSEATAMGQSALFVEAVGWARPWMAGQGLPDDLLPDLLATVGDSLAGRLPLSAVAQCLRDLEAADSALSTLPLHPPSYLSPDQPLGELATRYLEALLAGRRQAAVEMILEAARTGTRIRDLYLHVFQPCQYEIGRRWQVNELSVAQEHFCTAVTQLVMAQLYPYIFSGQKNGHTLLMTCVGSELHEIGARMVADFFEMEGWDTFYLGANTPTPDVLEGIDRWGVELLCVSTTMTRHVGRVADLVREARSHRPELLILVGGYPFNTAPELWRTVGADGHASDAQRAIHLARRLFSSRDE